MKTLVKIENNILRYLPIIMSLLAACLAIVVLIIAFVSENIEHKKELYSKEEYREFKTGDTIYVKDLGSIKRGIVLRNDIKWGIIEVRDSQYEWDVSFIEYD